MPKRTTPSSRESHPLVVAYAHPGHVDGSFHNSVVDLAIADLNTRRLIGTYMSLESGPRIASTRNRMCRAFLDDQPDATHLLMIDSDMVFEPRHVFALYDTMLEHDLGVASGLCFSVSAEEGMKSTALVLPPTFDPNNPPPVATLEPWERAYGELPDNDLVEVVATGAAFLMIRRDVLEKIRERGGENEHPSHPKPWLWFAELSVGDGELGEDVAFCMRAREVGVPTMVHTGITIGHRKKMNFDANMWRSAHAVEQSILPPRVTADD